MSTEFNINLYNILIAVGSIQGLIFSFVVFFNPKYKTGSNIYLAFLIAFISFNNIYYWFIDAGFVFNIQLYKKFYIPWALLITPAYYYFVNSYLNRKRIKIDFKNYLLFPFYIFFFFRFNFYKFTWDNK